MSRCPYLDYETNSFFFNTNDKYICKLIDLKIDVDDPKIKYLCKAEYGDKYKECEIYIDKA
mgnify:CR=1 FL=1